MRSSSLLGRGSSSPALLHHLGSNDFVSHLLTK